MARGKGEGSVHQDKSSGLWVARVELPSAEPGKRRYKKKRSKSKAEAIRNLQDMQRDLRAHGDLHSDSMTVAQWFEYWDREFLVKTRRPKTVGAYRSIINGWVVPTIGSTRLDKLSAATLRRVFTAMENATDKNGNPAPKSSTYMRNAHSVMSAAFGDAEREGRIHRNPAELIQAPRKSAANLEAFTIEEATDLIWAFGDEPDSFLWATFLLTGARRGEILGLEWDRVTDTLDLSWQLQRLDDGPRPADFEYRHIEGGLYWTRPKTNKGWRIIPLVDPLKTFLEAWRAVAPENPWGLVFTRQTQAHGRIPWDPDYATRHWVEVRKSLGITKNVRLHDLRHATAAILYEAGVPEDIIEAILGHSTAAMSRHYRGRVPQKRLEAGLLQLSEKISRP